MKIISVLSRKGGVGKTLLSVGLAQVLGEQGHRVALLDRDPEGSAMGWKHGADESRIVLPYEVIGPIEATRLRPVDYLIVDTPPNDTRTLQDTAKQSHYMLIPLLPGAGEMDRLQETVQALAKVKLQPGVRLGFVLNRAEHDNVSAAMRPALEELGYPVVAQVRKAVDYQRAFGGLIPRHLTPPFTEALRALEVTA
ncbi:chromosome partitioning protein [Deinococcus reticulitermitis]|uniref:Chromosome partitioning protein n=1 Tax=Deinococcus reticulitermitis TaxID=856736 RepID=A0A1H6ZT60_9DEIO|nr:ParA family protein [Deinococcus reticulitermitis]SEJ55816.1 chromosome partitioning protein [Deinococcus reticulitermitis]